MSDLAPILKDPDEIRTLTVDTTDLLASGEAVSGTPTWAVEGAPGGDASPLTVSGETFTAPNAMAQISAGTLRETYTVRCRIVTDTGQNYDRSFTVRIGYR